MKPLAIWLAIVAVVFGIYAAVTIALQETERVFVVVDASQPMSLLENSIVVELDRIDDRDDAEFALATVGRSQANTGLVHAWRDELRWGGAALFGPCSFDQIETFVEAADADERILITTSGSCDADELADWEVVELGP